MKQPDDLKVAIVCDWLTGVGGAELVLLELHRLFPNAPIYTSQYDPKKIDWFKDADVRTGWLQKFPSSLKKLLPVLRAFYFSRLDLRGYDLVISSNTGAECKGIKTSKQQIHICYMHAPTHYYWSRYDDYIREPGWGRLDWLGRLGLRLLVGPMRKWDRKAAQNPDHIITNSSHSQAAIKQYYDRDSIVIYPPVDVDFFQTLPTTYDQQSTKRSGFVITGRQVPYKRFDLAVQACSELGLPLKVLGDGPDHNHLKEIAGPSVEFLGHTGRDELRHILQTSEAFIFPGVDDFGISPVEAMAAGTPVIAFRGGGALDYVIEGKTGQFFKEQTVDSLTACLKSFKASDYSSDDIKAAAQKFGKDVFIKNIRKVISNKLQ